jgi:hypothetical protein
MCEDTVDILPCAHVVGWFTDDGFNWRDSALEGEYKRYLEQQEEASDEDSEDYSEDDIDSPVEFLEKKNYRETRTFTDGGTHGVSATFIFR